MDKTQDEILKALEHIDNVIKQSERADKKHKKALNNLSEFIKKEQKALEKQLFKDLLENPS